MNGTSWLQGIRKGEGPPVINIAKPFLWIKRYHVSLGCHSGHLINITQIHGTDIYNHEKKQGCLDVWGTMNHSMNAGGRSIIP